MYLIFHYAMAKLMLIHARACMFTYSVVLDLLVKRHEMKMKLVQHHLP